MNTVIKIVGIGLLALPLLSTPNTVLAQTTNEAGSTPKPGHTTNQVTKTEKKPVAGPFHGKLLACDNNAKTITVGKRTFQITSETKIKKAGKPGTLADAVVGEPVSGYVKPIADGKWNAVSINFGPKPQEASSESKKAKPNKEQN
jgi:hypothetical protein